MDWAAIERVDKTLPLQEDEMNIADRNRIQLKDRAMTLKAKFCRYATLYILRLSCVGS